MNEPIASQLRVPKMTPQQQIKPSSNLYGITHDPDGTPRIIEPKTVKVSIGLPKGKAIYTYIDPDEKWVLTVGYGRDMKRHRFATKEEAQQKYREFRASAPERKYPEKLPFFTFLHVAASGDFEPDWDVIEAHGPMPTEIDIVFVHEDPFSTAFQMWTPTEKKCEGDGKVAIRNISLTNTDEEKKASEVAKAAGLRVYGISSCYLSGCQYARSINDAPPACKPMGQLRFQLFNNPRIGATAVFNTGGIQSIKQIFSAIHTFKMTTGGGKVGLGFVTGIPLKMVVRPYRLKHGGKMVTQYAVGLEFRAENALKLKQQMISQGVQYRIAGRESLSLLNAAPPIDSEPDLGALLESEKTHPAAIAAEFAPGEPIDETGAPADPADDPELGPVGDLAAAWEDEETQSLPPAEPKATVGAIESLYTLCRTRGMNDTAILEMIGAAGFEKYDEITVAALPGLMESANKYKPNQGSLL